VERSKTLAQLLTNTFRLLKTPIFYAYIACIRPVREVLRVVLLGQFAVGIWGESESESENECVSENERERVRIRMRVNVNERERERESE
jgi:hypothetical protein